MDRFLSVATPLAVLVTFVAAAPRVIEEGPGHAIAFALAGGVFTIALAVYIRD
jgi:uncharacterized membrane protein